MFLQKGDRSVNYTDLVRYYVQGWNIILYSIYINDGFIQLKKIHLEAKN